MNIHASFLLTHEGGVIGEDIKPLDVVAVVWSRAKLSIHRSSSI